MFSESKCQKEPRTWIKNGKPSLIPGFIVGIKGLLKKKRRCFALFCEKGTSKQKRLGVVVKENTIKHSLAKFITEES